MRTGVESRGRTHLETVFLVRPTRGPSELAVQGQADNKNAFPSEKAVALKNQIIPVSQRQRRLHTPAIIVK